MLAISDLWENKTAVLGCQPVQRGAGEGQPPGRVGGWQRPREEECHTWEYLPGREEELAGGRNPSRQITLEIFEARLKDRQPEEDGLAHSQPRYQGTH